MGTESPRQVQLQVDSVMGQVTPMVFLGEKIADNCRKYQDAKETTKKAMAVAKATHYGDVNEKLELRDDERYLYRLAKLHHRQTEDIVSMMKTAIFSRTARRH
ncbi:unnamed protein product [Heligmosomoides polygyrus]|uniref:BAR domain-containing protein n=1 Tax=Heligmosomoides polygyrus TaxID=6339 RepID=A0A183GR88_HELPZ|nr:unnamed protein product [Heligmosomoides polygyrus]